MKKVTRETKKKFDRSIYYIVKHMELNQGVDTDDNAHASFC